MHAVLSNKNWSKGAIVKEYSPEKIILFGSLAENKVHQWSDIDLAIVKETKERFIERLHKVHLMASPSIGVNFIVYTPQEVQSMLEQNHYFLTDEILKKGKVLGYCIYFNTPFDWSDKAW